MSSRGPRGSRHSNREDLPNRCLPPECTAATKAQAAAVAAAGGGTAGAVTTDYTGKGYEVTVTKSDGSSVEVHLDSSFNAVRQ